VVALSLYILASVVAGGLLWWRGRAQEKRGGEGHRGAVRRIYTGLTVEQLLNK
jgi:hypothetical protein